MGGFMLSLMTISPVLDKTLRSNCIVYFKNCFVVFNSPSDDFSHLLVFFVQFARCGDGIRTIANKLADQSARLLADSGRVHNRDGHGALNVVSLDVERWAIVDLHPGVFPRPFSVPSFKSLPEMYVI